MGARPCHEARRGRSARNRTPKEEDQTMKEDPKDQWHSLAGMCGTALIVFLVLWWWEVWSAPAWLVGAAIVGIFFASMKVNELSQLAEVGGKAEKEVKETKNEVKNSIRVVNEFKLVSGTGGNKGAGEKTDDEPDEVYTYTFSKDLGNVYVVTVGNDYVGVTKDKQIDIGIAVNHY